jgi:hypothetical protein
MSQLQVTGEAKIRDIQGPVVANSGVITALDGAASQYVRGDGTLADFPTSSGGGSSVSYYLNSSVSQGTIGGVAYRELSKEPIIGAGTDIAISANGYVASYLTDANDPDVILIPGGNFNCEFYFSVNNNTGNPFFYAELYKYDGTTFTLLGSSVGVPEYINQGTVINPYYFAIPVATANLALTDRLAIRIYVNVDGRTVTLHTENGHLCQVVTTLSKGMVSLNNLTDQSQFITTGTSGTNFNIVSSGDTHTFNIPSASATNRGLITTGAQTIAGNKVFLAGVNVDNLQVVNATLLNHQTGLTPTLVGTTAIGGSANGLFFNVNDNGRIQEFIFDSTGDRDYTFPALSGTLALLEGAQTFSGAKTFSLDINVNGINVGKGGGSGLTYNTRVGALNFMSNTTGAYNSSFGYESLNANTTGLSNTAIGFSALSINTTGNYNTSIGAATMQLNTTGYNNTAVGYGALTYSLGSYNVAVGSNALGNNTTGYNNTAIGQQAGSQITTGANNTIIGAFIGSPTMSNNIILADGAGNIRYQWNGTNNQFTGPTTFGSSVTINTAGQSILSIVSSAGNSSDITSSIAGVLKSTISTSATEFKLISAIDNILKFQSSTNFRASLIFSNTADYSYTYPNADGTIALTSNLSSYVPYSGATASVALGTNTLTASTLIVDQGTTGSTLRFKQYASASYNTNGYTDIYAVSNNIVGFGLNQGSGNFKGFSFNVVNVTTNQSRDLYIPDASGTIALTSQLPTYGNLTSADTSQLIVTGGTGAVIGAGTSITLLNASATNGGIVSTGTQTFAGAKTFSSSVTAATNITSGTGAFDNGGFFIPYSSASASSRNWKITNDQIAFGDFSIKQSSTQTGLPDTIRLYISAAGNVGIGTTSPNSNAGYSSLTINGSTGGQITLRTGDVTEGYLYNTSSSLVLGADTGNFLAFDAGGSERMRITSGGSVLIGTTTSTYGTSTRGAFEINGSTDSIIALKSAGTVSAYLFSTASNTEIYSSTRLDFATNGSERMRITSGGNVGIGNTGNASYKLFVSGNTYIVGATSTGADISLLVQNSSSTTLFYTRNDGLVSTGLAASSPYNNTSGTVANAIFASDGTLQRSTVSSIRYKENIKDWNGNGLDTILALKPKTFKYKKEHFDKGDIDFLGLIAEEVAEVSPYLADYENEDRTGQVENVRYAFIVVPLIKAIQEQQAQIEELKELIKNK